jgi:HPt (histidine-containing phosphotransfer) domain-containing protein
VARGRVDEGVLAQLAVDLGPRHVEEICRLFLENATREVRAVSQALDAGDPERAALSAHRLKSASGFVGANGLVDLCAEVESGAATRDLGDLLSDELERTAAELNVSVGRLGR